MKDLQILKKEITKKLNKKNINIKKLSEEIDIKYTTLYGYLKNDFEPKYNNLKKICEYLNIYLDEVEINKELIDNNLDQIINLLDDKQKIYILQKLLNKKD